MSIHDERGEKPMTITEAEETIADLKHDIARYVAANTDLLADVERLTRERDEALAKIKRMDEALVKKRLCVLCGKEWDASVYKRGDTPCGAEMPCTLDMTETEAFNYWRQKWHDDFSARAARKEPTDD